jgi:phenylalanyl-tRNA synthetase beta chain
MKISMRWLRRYLDLSVDDDELGELFTSLGLEVESVEKIGVARQKTLVVGQVLEIEKHPNADKLSLCRVCVGEGDVRQIVCGAKNFTVGDRIPVALPGTILPDDFRIGKSELRGVVSDGMMCSGREIGIGDDNSGLLILDENTTIGAILHDEICIDCDTIYDLSLTANRGDCMCHIGVARDLAAKLNVALNLPKIDGVDSVQSERPDGHFLEAISIETSGCECYAAVCVRGIKIGESPEWLRRDLAAVGIRSINNAVDVGNWVMMETGQPVHVFDAKKIVGNRLTIRSAVDGETMITLDGKSRALNNSMVVICDGERPLVVGGIVGSVDAEVDWQTVDVLIESAYFMPEVIRQASKNLNFSTESSQRFARDIDGSNVSNCGLRTANLLRDVCGGEVISKCWKVGSPRRHSLTIAFCPSTIAKLCGFAIPLDWAANTLQRLGFRVDKLSENHWNVTIPAHRPDIECAADIASECLRIHGTDKIPTVAARCIGAHRSSDRSIIFSQKAGEYLANHGFFECYNPPLRSDAAVEKFFGENSALKMENPVSVDQNCYRNSLIPGLVDALRFNIQNGNTQGKFFEIGRIVLRIDGKFNECIAIGCVATETPLERSWVAAEVIDFYAIKALISPLTDGFAGRMPNFQPVMDGGIWQIRQSAFCGFLNREKFCISCGLLDANFTKFLDVRRRLMAAEIIVHPSIFERAQPADFYGQFSQFPRISRDLSLVVGADKAAAEVEGDVQRAVKKTISGDIELESTNIFDAYCGEGVADGTKNIGIAINYRSNRRTLTDGEVQLAFNALQDSVGKLYGIRKQS